MHGSFLVQMAGENTGGMIGALTSNEQLAELAEAWACDSPHAKPCIAASNATARAARRDEGAARVRAIASMRTRSLVSFVRRLATVQLTMAALALGVPGDVFETGVYRGGTAVLMLEVLRQYAPGPDSGRAFWAADSFDGLPESEPADWEARTARPLRGVPRAQMASAETGRRGKFRASRADFERTLHNTGVLRPPRAAHLHVLQGWFNETLPRAGVARIAFLRLDGDIYSSTRDALRALYPRVSPGGLVYVDDYGSFLGCRNAVNEYWEEHNLMGEGQRAAGRPAGSRGMRMVHVPEAPRGWARSPRRRLLQGAAATPPPLLSPRTLDRLPLPQPSVRTPPRLDKYEAVWWQKPASPPP